MKHVFEEEIRNTLIDMTDHIESRDRVLRLRVIQKMQEENEKKEGIMMKGFLKVCIPAVCLIFIVGIIFTTPLGQTLADTIKKIFEPKQENILMEGTNENVNMTPIVEEQKPESEKVSYAIYLEDSMKRYTVQKGVETIEYIIPKVFKVNNEKDINEKETEVFMKIEQVTDKKYNDKMSSLMDHNTRNGYQKISEKETTIKNLKAKSAYFSNGPMISTTNNAASIYKQIYCIDNQQGGTFVITMQMPYGSDYMEGWLARFENMIKSFEINI